MKALLIAALVATSAPAFAATDHDQAADSAIAQEAVNEGLIPADQLDADQYQTEFVAPDRDRGDRGGRGDRERDDRGRRDRDRGPGQRPGRPMPPPRQQWQCIARDRIQRTYRGDAWDLNQARREAMRDCQRGSIVGRCRLVGCGRS